MRNVIGVACRSILGDARDRETEEARDNEVGGEDGTTELA